MLFQRVLAVVLGIRAMFSPCAWTHKRLKLLFFPFYPSLAETLFMWDVILTVGSCRGSRLGQYVQCDTFCYCGAWPAWPTLSWPYCSGVNLGHGLQRFQGCRPYCTVCRHGDTSPACLHPECSHVQPSLLFRDRSFTVLHDKIPYSYKALICVNAPFPLKLFLGDI